jgi:RNA polymerase sigma-70 factor (ECF subfamily)
MQESFDLASIFLHHVPQSAQLGAFSADDRLRLQHLLSQVWDAGRRQWPDVPLAQEVFVRHLAARLSPPDPADPVPHALEVLAQLAHSDLYLACACAQGIPAAILAFERHYLARLPMMLGHLRQPPAAIEDVCQQMRAKFLVCSPEAPPKIAEYSGRGTLLSWVRIITTRAVLYMLRTAKRRPEDPVAAVCEALPSPGVDPELDLIKRNYHREFRQAVADAFDALSEEERHLLRLCVVERLSTSEIGLVFQVNQSTASRWLKSARQRVYEETKRLLKRRLGLSSGEFESLLRIVDSELDISLSQILGGEDRAPRAPSASALGAAAPRT